jgi:hypothetical protein
MLKTFFVEVTDSTDEVVCDRVLRDGQIESQRRKRAAASAAVNLSGLAMAQELAPPDRGD